MSSTFLQLLFSGVALGAAYAMTALGFVAIYRASQVFNFAHGELLAFGAFAMSTACRAGLPWLLALLSAALATGLLAAAIERMVLRPLIGRPLFATIILTIFIGLLLREGIHLLWGTDVRGLPTPWPTAGTFSLFGARLLWNSLFIAGLSALVLFGFFLLEHKTRIGLSMRAVALDQEAALAVGIPVGKILSLTWFLAGALAALAGACLSLFPGQVDSSLGIIAFRAFPAVILGGLESPTGTVCAALLLGVAEMLCQGYINPLFPDFGQNLHQILPYLLMMLFLLIRPYGLFGQRDVERV